MRQLAERLGVADAITLAMASARPSRRPRRWRRAHALIVPSTWDEPFPLVTIEGALARVPLVASDVGGIGEGMHDEEHALLFARGDAAGGGGGARAHARAKPSRRPRASRGRSSARRHFGSAPISTRRSASCPIHSQPSNGADQRNLEGS